MLSHARRGISVYHSHGQSLRLFRKALGLVKPDRKDDQTTVWPAILSVAMSVAVVTLTLINATAENAARLSAWFTGDSMTKPNVNLGRIIT